MAPVVDRPLNICLLSYRSHPHCGGQGVYLNQLSRALKRLGHRIEVLMGPPSMSLDQGIRVHRRMGLDLYNPQNLFRTPSLRELCDPTNLMEWLGVVTMGFPEPYTFGRRAYKFLHPRRKLYDIVHDNQSLSYGVGAIARSTAAIATIHHPITIDRRIAIRAAVSPWKKLQQMRWYSFIGMQKRVARGLQRIITVSRQARKDIGAAFNIPAHRFRVVPNGIDVDRFYPLKGIQRLPHRIIVTTSAEVPLKGLNYLLRAIAAIQRQHRVELVVVGNINPDGPLSRLIADLGISQAVSFTGPLDPIQFNRQYARCAMAVVPSVYEGFGLPAGEAMACAVPVISTTGGALPEVVGPAGVLVPPADADALANAIAALLDHPQRGRTLGWAGYRRVQRHFTWDRAAAKTVAAYSEVLGEQC